MLGFWFLQYKKIVLPINLYMLYNLEYLEYCMFANMLLINNNSIPKRNNIYGRPKKFTYKPRNSLR